MKHIVIDARSRPSSTGRYIDRLLEHLQHVDQQHRYTVLLRPGDNWQPQAPNWSTIVCPYKQFSFNPVPLITFGLFLSRLKPDVVHFGMTPQEPIWFFGKRVTTTHDLTMLRFVRAGKLPQWLHALRMVGYRFLFWYAHKRASQIIVPTQFVANDLTSLRPWTKEKITVTYEASEPPLDTAAKQLRGVKEPFIMHVGSPLPHKNIERLIAAFEILKRSQPNLQLVLPGKKEQYFERLEASLQDNPIKDSVIIPGFVSDAELKWLYQNAEAYVLPSLSEGFGLPGLEAMAHGCPLVSSSATCMPEVYGNAAHYFDPENVEDMAAKINEVISSAAMRRDLIRKGYAQIKKYSWRKMAEQTRAVYARIVE